MTKHTEEASTCITFRAPDAREVFVAGSFNDWSRTAHAMTRDSEGRWDLTLALLPGRYEYKFVADGEWCCGVECDGMDGGGDECVLNAFGTMNRVLVVSK